MLDASGKDDVVEDGTSDVKGTLVIGIETSKDEELSVVKGTLVIEIETSTDEELSVVAGAVSVLLKA